MKFKIFLVYHSHIDIGYTERQEKMANYQADFIKQAVEFAISDKQKSRGENEKFKFTAEGFWAVEQYLSRYGGEGKSKLLAAITSKNFELTAGYLHMAELLNMKNLNHSLTYSQEFTKANNLPVNRVAMAADINGFSYGFADALYDSGVRYLSTSINTHHGGAPFNRPLVPFYWHTPKGNRILVWNGLTYHKANLLGLIPGLTPIGDPGIPGMLVEETGFIDVKNTDYAEKRIFSMVETLVKDGYDFDFLPIMGSGLYTDNSPVGDEHCKLVGEWNSKFGDRIEIVTSTLSEFFSHLEKTVKDIPTYAGDWSDWWTDGALSTPNETKLFRNAQRLESTVLKLDPNFNTVSKEEHDNIIKQLILYSEHTWGHSSSYTDPCKLLVTQLDLRKAKLAVDADILAGIAFDKVSRAFGEGEFTHRRPFEYAVVNPNAFSVKSRVNLPTDFWEEGYFSSGNFCIEDDLGNVLPLQKTYTLRGSTLTTVLELTANEKRTLKLKFGQGAVKENKNCESVSTKYYNVEFDKLGIISIEHKLSGQKIFTRCSEQFGAPIYQVFPNGVRSDAAGFGYSKRKKPKDEIYNATLVNFEVAEAGKVFTKLVAEFEIKGAKRAKTTYTFYNELSKFDVDVEIAKDLVLDPEGMYAVFPLSVNGGKWYLDKAGAFIRQGAQLPQTCCDYYAIDRGVALVGDGLSITINTYDTPLVMIDRLKLWDFTTSIEGEGKLYSWLTNNKWETNFRTQCAGFIESRYTIDTSDCSIENIKKTLEKNEYDLISLRK